MDKVGYKPFIKLYLLIERDVIIVTIIELKLIKSFTKRIPLYVIT